MFKEVDRTLLLKRLSNSNNWWDSISSGPLQIEALDGNQRTHYEDFEVFPKDA